jgi:cysteine-rich repeat protein
MKTRSIMIAAALTLGVVACSDDDGGNQNTQGNNNNDGNSNNMAPVCGDGLITDSEQCDGSNLGDHTCASIGWEGGELSCTPLEAGLDYKCKLDTTQCLGISPCGNGVIDFPERCDGSELGGATCSSASEGVFDGPGPLGCMPDCRRFNFGFCDRGGDFCGNGILDSGEMCDDGDDNSDTLPNACRTNCGQAFCGDGVIDSGEECDDGLANSNAIPDGCRLYCAPESPCTCRRAYCGDDVMDTGEECDGRDLGGLDCTDHGYAGGDLACTVECLVAPSGCLP